MHRYPDYPCYEEACKLQDTIRSQGVSHLDCIVSGLPFAVFTPELREELLEQIELSLKPGGLFVAFQYSLQMKKALKERFELIGIRLVLGNLPPAFVYVCRKPECV
jgi:phospholipid N-methyltransferase